MSAQPYLSRDPVSTPQREIVLLGASGLIGSALARKAGGTLPLRTIRWSEDAGLAESVAASINSNHRVDVILACGVTDPKISEAGIRLSNTEFPKKLISACLHLPHVRFITLGTVMEHFPEACAANAYLKSKLDLGLWISALAEKSEFAGRFRHIRLHTVYGGARELVKPHMFLGQMLQALERNTEFRMSSGDQLREYHHVDDIADSILHIAAQTWPPDEAALLGIHSATPVRLAELAEAVFKAFDKQALLQIGSIPRAPGENLGQTFSRSPASVLAAAREPISGVVQWIREILETDPRPPRPQ